MDTIVYVISNPNLKTVKFVAKNLKKISGGNIKELVIFGSPEDKETQMEELKIYEKHLGNTITTSIKLKPDGSIPFENVSDVFKKQGEKYVDLTNGLKVTSSSLYLAASLCEIENIYCGLNGGYIKIEKPEGFKALSKVSYFDLIYYTDEINDIFEGITPSNVDLYKALDGLKSAVMDFFNSNNNYRNIINSASLGNEFLINRTLQFLQSDNEVLNYCATFNSRNTDHRKDINLGYQGDKVGVITRFFKAYTQDGTVDSLLSLATISGLLSSIREYRNISAHYSQNRVLFDELDCRVLINMAIESFRLAKGNDALWATLKDNHEDDNSN